MLCAIIDPNQAVLTFIGNVTEIPPYQGAKLYFLIEEKLEDTDWFSELVRVSVEELSAPKSLK